MKCLTVSPETKRFFPALDESHAWDSVVRRIIQDDTDRRQIP